MEKIEDAGKERSMSDYTQKNLQISPKILSETKKIRNLENTRNEL